MSLFDQARNAAEDYAKNNPDQVNEAIQRVGEEVDQRTGGRFTDQIDQAEQAVAQQMGAEQADQPAAQDQPAQQDQTEGDQQA
ncbi:MT0933-like antitoxin protein [Raineyella antarctica]|uniref:MT0933-like antitoxin protein n=1 Tax=Raineyella antarctica TaxID=1577474 RepID=A0A1G6GQJ4_9ACTN|nr:antitoxin [Raineyella antarctica]SDB84312.1 MT0933-like antitoxin protein [Raineyella antarctica]